MIDPKIEAIIEPELQAGEEIVWTGKPAGITADRYGVWFCLPLPWSFGRWRFTIITQLKNAALGLSFYGLLLLNPSTRHLIAML